MIEKKITIPNGITVYKFENPESYWHKEENHFIKLYHDWYEIKYYDETTYQYSSYWEDIQTDIRVIIRWENEYYDFSKNDLRPGSLNKLDKIINFYFWIPTFEEFKDITWITKLMAENT